MKYKFVTSEIPNASNIFQNILITKSIDNDDNWVDVEKEGPILRAKFMKVPKEDLTKGSL